MAKEKETAKTRGSEMPTKLKETTRDEMPKQITEEPLNENIVDLEHKQEKQGRLPTFLELSGIFGTQQDACQGAEARKKAVEG